MIPPGAQRAFSRLYPALLAAPVAAYAVSGVFVRMIADDFCVAATAADSGPVGFMINSYQNWLGRYTDSFLSAFFLLLGPSWYGWLVPVLFVFWAAGLWWAGVEVARLVGLRSPLRTGALLGLVLMAAILAGTPVPVQSFFWIDAMVSYGGAVYAAPWLAACMLFTARRQTRLGLAAFSIVTMLIAFLFGGLGEPNLLAAIIILAGIALVMAAWRVRRAGAWMASGAALLGCIVSLGVMLASPGNAVRAGEFEQMPVFQAGIHSLQHGGAVLIASTLLFSPVAAVTAFLGTALIVYHAAGEIRLPPRRLKQVMAGAPALAFFAVAASVFPAFYALSLPPPGRLIVIPLAIWMTALAVLGGCIALLARRGRPAAVPGPRWLIAHGAALVCAVLLLLPPLRLLPVMQIFAEAWDTRDALIKQQRAEGHENIQVEPLAIDIAAATGLEYIGEDKDFWVNLCAADYSITRNDV